MWEYLVFEPSAMQGSNAAVQASLNKLGAEGWELVACSGVYAEKFMLKRPLAREVKTGRRAT